MDDKRLLGLTVSIVTGYVSAHAIAQTDLPALIRGIHDALTSLASPPALPAPGRRSLAQVRASIRPRGFVSLQDRRIYQLLRRRLDAGGR